MNRFLITPVRNEALLLERFLEHHAPLFEKIVIATRDRDFWLESIKRLFDDRTLLWKQGHLGGELHHRTYGTTLFERVKLLAAWERHHCEVGRYFRHRDGDLLWLHVDRRELRYETLAMFLGIKTPLTDPSPRANEARSVSGSDRLNRLLTRFPPFSPVVLLALCLKKRVFGR